MELGRRKPIHFVYDTPDVTQLYQGDVLKRTPRLLKVLEDVQPNYANNERNLFFLVLTQSCDLISRNRKPPSSPYITLAVVRPLLDVLRLEAKKYQNWWQECKKVIDTDAFNKLVLLTESLLNNNRSEYFYLHEEVPIINQGACAILTLTVSIKMEYYGQCLESKVAQLKESFRAKLGSMVGTSFSRVATEEWDQHYPSNPARKASAKILRDYFVLMPKEILDEGIKKLTCVHPLPSYSPEEIFDFVSGVKVKTKRQRFIKRIEEAFQEAEFMDKLYSSLVHDLQSNVNIQEQFQELFKENKEITQEQIEGIKSIFTGILYSILMNKDFIGRDKVINTLVVKLKEDEVIKELVK